MAQEFTLMNDIVSHHTERMQNLKRYYPFFKLAENTLAQYKDGRYASLDMGYIVLAVLRFFIEENHFKDQDVTYPMYEAFMRDFLEREFGFAAAPGDLPRAAEGEDTGDLPRAASGTAAPTGTLPRAAAESLGDGPRPDGSAAAPLFLQASGDEVTELIQYIFDKLCNDGRPFVYTYYDPGRKSQVRARVKLIDSRFKDDVLVYFITGDAIEFYLDTKEVKDESKITTEQLLLEKMIKIHNFGGALEVVRRINGEVGRLMVRKDEVVRQLGQNIFEGVHALDDFSKTVLAWFKEEQRLFESNKALVDKALLKTGGEDSQETLAQIYALDSELKRAIRRHSDLLAACTTLQTQADELIQKAKNSRFRNVFSFDDFLDRMVKRDQMDALGAFVRPLLGMNLHKTLNLYQLDSMLEYKEDEPEKGEAAGEGREQHYVYEDDAAGERIETNFDIFLKVLFEQLLARGGFDLKFLNHMYEMKFTDNILKNGDYFSFIVHLCQKKRYDLSTVCDSQDTFLEGMMARYLKDKTQGEFDDLAFELKFIPDELLTLSSGAQISNIYFSVIDRRER